MPKDKSQLDIYQIERETVVTEMSKSLAPVQQAQFTTLFETVTVVGLSIRNCIKRAPKSTVPGQHRFGFEKPRFCSL